MTSNTPFRSIALAVAILACAASAGIHGALTPAHFDEGTGAGVGFLAATALLAALAAAMLLRPDSRLAVALAAAVLAGLIVAYGLAVTSGVPVLHAEQEPVESFAVATKLIEAAGVLAAALVLHHAGRSVPARIQRPKGTLV
jgi:peptidoglycan/LPS O-acetylase OafA/YrhL